MLKNCCPFCAKVGQTKLSSKIIGTDVFYYIECTDCGSTGPLIRYIPNSIDTRMLKEIDNEEQLKEKAYKLWFYYFDTVVRRKIALHEKRK